MILDIITGRDLINPYQSLKMLYNGSPSGGGTVTSSNAFNFNMQKPIYAKPNWMSTTQWFNLENNSELNQYEWSGETEQDLLKPTNSLVTQFGWDLNNLNVASNVGNNIYSTTKLFLIDPLKKAYTLKLDLLDIKAKNAKELGIYYAQNPNEWNEIKTEFNSTPEQKNIQAKNELNDFLANYKKPEETSSDTLKTNSTENVPKNTTELSGLKGVLNSNTAQYAQTGINTASGILDSIAGTNTSKYVNYASTGYDIAKQGINGDLVGAGTSVVSSALGMSDNSITRAAGLLVGNGQSIINSISNLNKLSKAAKAAKTAKTAKEAAAIKDSVSNISKAGNIANIAGIAAGIADTALFGNSTPSEYSGKKGGITQGMDMAYDAILTGMSFVPVAGTIISAAMSGNKLLGHALKSMGGGTDGMTTADAILGSSLFGSTIGAVNGFAGKSTTPWTKDWDVYTKTGNSYIGSNALADQVEPYAGKKYGLVSSSARNKWEKRIEEARRLENLLRTITGEAERYKTLQQTMTGVDTTSYQNSLLGGFNNYTTFAKRGGHLFEDKLKRAHRIIIETKKVITIEPVEETKQEETVNVIPAGALHANLNHMDVEDITKKGIPVIDNYGEQLAEIERDEIIFRLEVTKLIEELKAEGTDEAAIKAGKLLTEEILYNTEDRTGLLDRFKQGGEILTILSNVKELTLPTFLLKLENGEVIRNYNKRDIKTVEAEKDWLNKNEWFRKQYKWNGLSDSYMPTEMILDWVTKQGEGNLYEPESFKDGGSINVIPEGSLHARLHHMDDAEGLTKKGIPVIDNDGEQQAEIELNEIIFRLEVTKKLEELKKKYSDENKDEIAIEAGKLLTEEILYNTNDRTGLIETV